MNQDDEHNAAGPYLHNIRMERVVAEEDGTRNDEEEGGGEERGGRRDNQGANAANGDQEEDDDEPLTAAQGPARYVPPELRLSQQEENWAWELVRRIEGRWGIRQGVRHLTDYEYAVYALVTRGNVQEATNRALAIQKFRETYNIQDTVEEGMRAVENFIRLQPGALLHADVLGPTQGGSSVCVWDLGKNFPSRAMVSDENWRIHVRFMYYLHRILLPNLSVLREGVLVFCETSSMSWDNVNMNYEEQINAELKMHDPVHFKQVRMYNTSSIANAFVSLIKRLVPARLQNRTIREVLVMGCQIESSDIMYRNAPRPHLISFLDALLLLPTGPKLKLSDLYLQPNYDVAMQNLLNKVRTLLQERYHNEQTFSL